MPYGKMYSLAVADRVGIPQMCTDGSQMGTDDLWVFVFYLRIFVERECTPPPVGTSPVGRGG